MIKKSSKMFLVVFLLSSIFALANEMPANENEEVIINEEQMFATDVCVEMQNECMDQCDSLENEEAKDDCYNKCDIAYENCLAQQDK